MFAYLSQFFIFNMRSTANELVPRSMRPRGAQGWCAGPYVEAEMNAELQQREETKKRLRIEPTNSNLRKAVKMPGKQIRKVLQGCRVER